MKRMSLTYLKIVELLNFIRMDSDFSPKIKSKIIVQW
jgi:hypothetical protein